MKKISTFIFLFCLCAALSSAIESGAQEGGDSAAQPILLKWLGNAGWEIQIGRTLILIDPFLTRKEADRGNEWKTDEAAVLSAIKRADYIFAGHSHADHIADIPYIAKKFGPKVVGSRTTVNIALTAGVDKAQLMTIGGGENLKFKEFSVQVIGSEHGILRRGGQTRRPKSEEITKPLAGPVMGNAFVEGGSYLYCFTFGNHRLLHQSTGGFIAEKIAGLKVDTALLYPMERSDLAEMLKVLRPKTVFLHHFDRWRLPFADGLPEPTLGRGRRFTRDVNSIDGNIKVIVPKFFESHELKNG